MEVKTFEAAQHPVGSGSVWLVTINGRTKRIDDWCEILDRNWMTVRSRIVRGKWSVRDALLTETPTAVSREDEYSKIIGCPCFKTWAREQIAQGVSRSEIARRLGQPVSTVNAYLATLFGRVAHKHGYMETINSEEAARVLAKGDRYTLLGVGRVRYLKDGEQAPVRLTTWCEQAGIKDTTVKSRIVSGWALDAALTTAVDSAETDEHAWELELFDVRLKQPWGAATKPGRWERGCWGKAIADA